MKIALVSPYDFAYPGGVVNHITALERQFTRLGHDVRVIAPASRVVPDFGQRFIPIGKPRPVPVSGSIARITLSLRLASKIKEVLERENFDIIHLHEPFMPMLCSAVLRFARVPAIGTFHACAGRPGYYFGWPISAMMIKRRTPKLKTKICVSVAAMRYTRKWVHGNFEIVPNGIDLDLFSPAAAPFPEYKDGKTNILFVGRLESRKGLIYLLKAYRRIKEECGNTRLIIVGPGKRLRNKYEKWVKNNRLDDVVFVGYASQEDLPRYYQTADIFCAPATGRESFGIVLLEAMAMEKPIVATSIEGYRCVLTNGVEGIMVPPRNDKQIARALMRLITNPGLRRKMGDNGRQKAQQYGWKRIARRVLDCYYKIVGGYRSQKQQAVFGERFIQVDYWQMALVQFRKDVSVRLTRPLVQVLSHTGVTPDVLTWAGFLLSVGAGALIGTGHMFAGGWVVLVGGAFDMLDGALARFQGKATVFGSALDSTLDRLSEAILFLAIIVWYVQTGSGWLAVLSGGALVGSFMVSYIRARAEGLGLELKEGFFTRVERIIVLVIGLLLSQWEMALIIALGIVLVLSFVTAGQRLFLVWVKTRKTI